MSKICFIGDIHGKKSNPLNRLCDYNEDLFKKLTWIRDYCIENKIETIIHLGDIFDKPEATDEWKNKFIQIWKHYTGTYGYFYSIIGKLHDLFYNVAQSYPKTCLYNLELSGVLQVLDNTTLDFNTVKLHVLSMHTKEAKEQILKINKDLSTTKDNIILAHQFFNWSLDPNAGFTEEELLGIKTNCSLVLGHDHRQYEDAQIGCVTVRRPGSLMRTELSETTIQMKPRILIYNNGLWNYVEVLHKDISEIYNIQEYRTKKSNIKLFTNLKNNLEDISKYIHQTNNIISCSEALKELNCPAEEYEYLRTTHQNCCQEF